MKKFFAFLSVFLFAGLAFAQVPSPTPLPDVTNDEFIQFLLQSLGGLKGASALVIAGILIQVLIKFLSTSWAKEWFKNLTGEVKLIVVGVLSFLGGLITLVSSGVSWQAALLHSTTLTAFMVLANQIYQHFFAKKP